MEEFLFHFILNTLQQYFRVYLAELDHVSTVLKSPFYDKLNSLQQYIL